MYKPLECVACIVVGSFSELVIANFDAAYLACNECSCKKLPEDKCNSEIQVVSA